MVFLTEDTAIPKIKTPIRLTQNVPIFSDSDPAKIRFELTFENKLEDTFER